MKIIWESDDWPGCIVDSSITCLNWIPNGNSADTGLLATGSESGAVGVTATQTCPLRDDNKRVNFNLRGHHATVNIVAWNKEQMKLASCDSSGIIYVWVPNEERWSVELVNDRGIKVRGVSWSPNGLSALICYEDNFVLIGSATGQRIWSSSFPVTVSCGVWAPDSREIILGFINGTIQVLNEQGTTVTERKVYVNGSVRFLAASSRRRNDRWTLAVCSAIGLLNFLNSYDEIDNAKWQCNETLLSIQWNANGTLLAAVCKENHFFIMTYQGNVVCDSQVSQPSATTLNAFTWVHDDRFIIATSGNHLAVGRALHDVPSLFSLVTYNLWQLLGASARHVDILPLPPRERDAIRALDHHIIRCRVPSQNDMLMKVCEPSDWRWYCTIRPVPSKVHTYVLCMEHMAGLIPVLLGKQTNRIIPQFQISLYNPKLTLVKSDSGSCAQVEDIGTFARPSTQRNSVWRKSKRQLRALMNRYVSCPVNKNNGKLVQITSNVWCTRFKMLSVATNILPTFLAQVVYKTSVLHLQPRQMTVQLADLTKRTGSPPISSHCVTYRNPISGTQPSNDSSFSNESTVRSVAIAPNDRTRGIAIDIEPLLDETVEEPLSTEEKLLFQSILSEFNDLRAAVERHIAKMKCFASDLERSSQKLDSFGGTTSVIRYVSKVSTRATALPKEICIVGPGTKTQCSELTNIGPSTSTSRWSQQFDDIEYIDEDDDAVIHDAYTTERTSLIDRFRATETSRKGMRQLSDITSVLDKLTKLANDLTTRCAVGQLNNDESSNLVNLQSLSYRCMSDSVKESHATVSSLRTQLKDISKKVSQIEKKISYGDELLDEVCGDLQERIQHIKAVLGDQPALSDGSVSFLTMNNKAPFWNEASQVYQLDFGGRVTQESAKNFQIEYDDQQVMQFGRIENGAYTLDFRSPFSAVQAFAVALASITQRLK
ncbi:tub family protein [Loa loa]|uniref:Tub family protein n=1 Tax=Loa loa TaxID=7209 RepID=A0A1I7VYQ0_LOALO|nr:tub family protein [Loa loa]EFO25401.1 tub family protein [Loa loa]